MITATPMEISLWRLIQHDYGNTNGDPSKVNMNPALDVLYGLALVQSALFSYSMILWLACGKVVKEVALAYGFQGDAVTSVSDYLEKTLTELAKDPSLSMGRNLITYAVKLMESESPDDGRSGIMILDTIITYAMKNKEEDAISAAVDEYLCGIKIPEYILIRRRGQGTPLPPRKENKGEDMLMLIERLLGSPSSSKIFHKLLKALGSRSPHRADDDIDIRESSARIVAYLAGNIRLNEYPQVIECISSLFDSSGQHVVDRYKELVLQGLRIFGMLAADQENCRVMGRANGLVSMIMKPVSSDLLHRVDHATWADIVDASLGAMYSLLTTAPKDIAPELGEEVSNNRAAIESMHTILGCKDCGEERDMLAMKILTALPTESKGDITGRLFIDKEKITGTLASIFCDKSKDSRIRELAGERLVKLSFQSQSIALLQEECNLVDSLAAILLEDRVNKCRISAAGILEGLCSQYRDEECFQQFKNVITNVMPKVLSQIFSLESTQVQVGSYAGQVCDIEGQNSVAPGGNGQKDGQHDENELLQVALLSLYVTVYEKLISSTDQDSDLHIIDDASSNKEPYASIDAEAGADPYRKKKDDVSTFLGELKEMALRNGDHRIAGCLRTLKLISKMAISMMRQEKGIYVVQDMESLIGALGSASQSMLGLDGFVLITGRDDGETLASLVETARGLCQNEKGGTRIAR